MLPCIKLKFVLIRGGGGKPLTMNMTPWNLIHGQWSKKLTMATDILKSAALWFMVKMIILWSNFVVRSKVYHFDHRKLVFRPWSWSKRIFLWLNFVVGKILD